VPDNVHTQTGLGVGDRFSVAVPNRRGESVEYTIAGVVSVPGWHWFTKFSDVRRRSGRALALVFVDYGRAKADYGIERTSFFWMNADTAVPFQEMEARLQPIADRNAGVRVNVPMVGEAAVGKQYVKITERQDLTDRLFKRANDIIWSLTWFPLIALACASNGPTQPQPAAFNERLPLGAAQEGLVRDRHLPRIRPGPREDDEPAVGRDDRVTGLDAAQAAAADGEMAFKGGEVATDDRGAHHGQGIAGRAGIGASQGAQARVLDR
jgi:hypothetical protein